jgi:hypothetical protein
MSLTEFVITLVVGFVLFGFLRRVVYFQAYSSFTKAADDFRRRQEVPRKPEGTVTVDQSAKQKGLKEEGEYVDYEELK